MDTALSNIAISPYFNGSIMLLMNIGGKYLAMDLPKNLDTLFINYEFLRYIVLFSIFFMATRNIKISIFEYISKINFRVNVDKSTAR